MRHPFDGIIPTGDGTIPAGQAEGAAGVAGSAPAEPPVLARRTFLGRTVGAVAGLAAGLFGAGRQAAAQTSSYHVHRPDVTTQALGEEGGYFPSPPPSNQGPITTYALGEEGGPRHPHRRQPYPPYYPPSYYPPQYHRPRGSTPSYTTYALGEEGGARPSRPPYYSW